jgi:transmembrane sensor
MTHLYTNPSTHETHAIAAEAERRFVRSLSPDCTAEEHAATALWRHADTAHEAAYQHVRAVWRACRSLANEPDAMMLRKGAEAVQRPFHNRRRGSAHRLRRALAACVAVSALGLGGQYAGLFDTLRPAPMTADHQFQTAIGERRAAALADGSEVVLNTGTAVEAHLDGRQRAVTLRSGEALFDVAHDARRPFVVAVGDDTVTALGTRFQVRHTDANAVVTLFEGKVRIARADGSARVLSPGEQAWLAAAGGISVRSIQVQEADAWSRGWLVFRDEPLSEVVAEVNRYATTPINLADPALGNLRLSGNFRVGDSTSMASAMAALLPLRVTTQGEGLALAAR